MKRIGTAALSLFSLAVIGVSPLLAGGGEWQPVLLVHGGAGRITRDRLPEWKERVIRAEVTRALLEGYRVLERGGTSVDAVEQAVRVLEDSPWFNAGRGAVRNRLGRFELDASIMDGRSLNAGAVAGVRHIRNPILLARLVMERTPHVLLAGEGAERFAVEQGMELVDPTYFEPPPEIQERQRAESACCVSEHDGLYGTVGAVALDKLGNLAAATSTGGVPGKMPGRIGDSPIIGAGTYADNRACAVSCTGIGEYFIRLSLGHYIATLVRVQHFSIEEAAREALRELERLGGSGGFIVLDQAGRHVVLFNTEGMVRGWIKKGGDPVVELFARPD